VERAFISAAPSLEVHRCNKRFLRFFIQVTFLRFQRFFLFFPRFLFKKTLSNAKYNKYVKIRRKIFLEDDLAMIFIDFSLLRSLYCKISYLLKSTEVIQVWEFDNLHMTQCAKIIGLVGFMANVGNVFYLTFTNVFFYFLHVFYVF